MAEMLLINPRRRRRTTKRRHNPLAATHRRRRHHALAKVTHRRRRRHNPLTVAPARRRMNPLARRRVMHARRRRNPIYGRMGTGMLMTAIREAFIGGAGSIAVDLAMGQINKFLPVNLQSNPAATGIGAGDAIKAIATVMLGHFLAGPTRGLSRKMAMGALTVQSAQIMRKVLPLGTMPLGYSVPGLVTQGSARVSPNMGMGAYTAGTPLLSAYMRPDQTALLSGVGRKSASMRENVYAFK
ncbi:MAG: hypothetical protein EBT27_09580 [Betaproteobacteria bacterium]|nr:hypothetical protein [Betaproteobacteria bacterium]